MGSSGGEGESQRAQPIAAKPRSKPAQAQDAQHSGTSDGEDLAGVSGLEAQTIAHMRVPHFGVRYLEQARRQLFARHPDYLPFLVRHLGVHPGMTVVDVGCGTGVYTRILASRLHGEGRAIGVDLHPAVVAHAHAASQAEGWGETIEYRVGDAAALPLPDACADVVFCNSLLWLLRDPAAALREMRRVLRSGGRALAAEPDGGLIHSFDPKRPRLSELEERFQACFARGSLTLDGFDYDIGRKLPALFLVSGFVAIRAYPRLFIAAGCDLGDDPHEGLRARVEEYQQALEAMLSDAPDARAHQEHHAQRARAGGMTDEELAEHERATVEYLRERITNPVRILTDGSVYMYGGVLCEGLRFDDDQPPGSS
jgi:SAM-dependent methyltransferase